MSSLIPESEKTLLQEAFNDLHDTFARPVYYFKESKKVIIQTNPSYNPIYGQGQQFTESIKNVIDSGSFNARITYDTDKANSYINDPEIDSQLKLRLPDGYVRIKVDASGYNVIKKTKRVVFDERTFSIESDVRPHGLFTPSHYTFFLLPTEK
jgi:hypothetical protein